MNEQLQAIYNQYKTVAPDVTEEMFINGYNLSGDDYLSAIDEVLKKKEPTEPTTAENIQTQTESIVPTTVMEQLQGVPQNQVDDRFQQSATSSVSDITPQPISTELPSTETASIGVNDLQPNQPITTNIATPTEQPLGDIGIAQMPTFKKPNLGAVVYPINQEEAQERQKVIDRINIGINERNRQIRLENQKLTPTVTETQTTNDNIKTTNDTYDGRKIVTDEKGVKYVDYGNNNFVNLSLMPTIKTEEQQKKEREDFLKDNNLDHAKTKFKKVTLETQFGDDKYYSDGTQMKDVESYNKEVWDEVNKGNYKLIEDPKTSGYLLTPEGRYVWTYAKQELVDTENKRREDLAKAGEEHNKDNARQRLGDALNPTPKQETHLTQWGNELYKETGYLLDENDYQYLTTGEERARFFATKKADKELKENPNANYNDIFQKEFKEQSKEQFTPAQYEKAGNTVADMFVEAMDIEAENHYNTVGAKEVSDRYSGYNAEAHNKERNFLNRLKQDPAFKRQVGEWRLKEGQYRVADYKERFFVNANTQNKRTALIDQIQAYSDNEDNTNSEVQSRIIEQRKNNIRQQANKGNFTEVEKLRNDINSSAEIINKNDDNKKNRNQLFDDWRSNMTVTNEEQDRIDKLTAQANSGDGWARAKVTLINTVDKTVKGLVKDPILGVLGVVNMVAGSDRLQDVLDDAKKRQAYGSHTTDNMFNITNDYKLNGVNVKEKVGRFFSVDKNGTWSPLKLSYSDKENLQFVKTTKSFSVTGAFSDTVGQIASMTGANYIGKTAYLMTGLKGLNTVKTAINILGKESAITKSLVGIRNFAGNTANQGAVGWFLQTYADNYQEGKQKGMNNSQSNMYALMQSAITGVLSKINPDAKFFNTSYKNLQQQLITNLVQGNRNGIINALKSFGKDVIKHGGKEIVGENIQEFVESIAGQGYKIIQQPFTDAKFDAMTWDDVMETAIATTLSTGGIAIGNRMMQGRNPNIIQFDGGNFDLNRLTKAEKMVMLSRLDTSSSFDDLKTNFLTNNKSVDRVERELSEIKRLSDKIPNATQYSLEANAFAVQGLYKIEQLRSSEKSADPMFKEQIQAEVTAIETKIKEVLDNDIKEQQGETETVNPNPTTETPNTETEIIKPNLSDIHSQISAMDKEYQSLDLKTDEGKSRKAELENERNALMENVSVDDIKAEAKAHAETYPQLSADYEKAQKDLEQNPKDKTLKQKEKEAGQRLNDFANESNKFNELLKAKGDKGLFVNGNYVPFKGSENTTTVEQTTKALSELDKDVLANSNLPLNELYDHTNPNDVAKAYHVAKETGANPELVTAVDNLLNKKNETKENTTAESGKQSKDKTDETTKHDDTVKPSVQAEKDKTDFTDEEDLDFLNNFKEEEKTPETKPKTISHKGNEYTRHEDGTYTKPDKNGKDRKVTSPNTIKALNDLHEAENVVETKEKDGYTYKKYKDGRETITSPKGNVIEPKVKRGNKTVANANFSKRKDIIFDRETEHSLKVQSNKEINSILNNFIPTNEKEVAMMYFANGGKINPKSVNKELLGNSERKKRRSLNEHKWVWFGKNNKDSFEVVSEKLSAESDLNLDQMELRNALIDVAMSYDSSTKIADEIVKLHKKSEDPYYGWSEGEIEAQQAYEKEMYGDTEVDIPEMEYAYDENEDDFPFSATNEANINTTPQQKAEAKSIVKFLSNKFKGLFADGQKAFDEKMKNLGIDESSLKFMADDFRDYHSAPNMMGYDDVNEAIEDSADTNLSEIARGKHLVPDDYFKMGSRYPGHNTKSGIESKNSILRAIDKLKKGADPKSVTVKMYRAVPKDIALNRLIYKDWITPSKNYAIVHGESRFGEGEYKIIEEDVPAHHIWWDGNDINEWGFDPTNDIRFIKNKNGTVFGLYDPKENKIYLNEKNLNPKTVWHEATHFQQAILKAMAGKGNTEAKAILSQFEKLLKPFIAQLEKGKTTVTINGQDIPLKADVYRKGKNESTEAYKDRMQDEVWAFLQQEENNKLWQKNDTPFKRAVNKFKEAITNLYKSVFNIPKGKDISNMTLAELVGHTAKQLQEGRLISPKDEFGKKINDFANMTLDKLFSGKELKGAKDILTEKEPTISNLTDTQLERLLRNQNLITDGKCA